MECHKKSFFIFLLACAAISIGCGTKKSKIKYQSPPGYDLEKPTIVHLKGEVDEISGMYFYPKDTSVFSITDEAGYLYKIFIRKKIEIEKWKFSKNADFEDISLVDSVFFALQSSGAITSFKFTPYDSVQADVCGSPLSGKNEFESMYYDEFHSQLVLLCKDCKTDKKNSLTAYGFDPVKKAFADTPFFVMDVNKVAGKLGLDKMKLKPSAAGIHPITKELYIISSVNKALIIADRDGNVKEAYQIDPAIFKQPEGLTFTPKGDLLISNEAAEVGAPNILIYKYKARTNGKG
jgi:hypothetical protein